VDDSLPGLIADSNSVDDTPDLCFQGVAIRDSVTQTAASVPDPVYDLSIS
jgi:hypothetical protein